MPGARNATAVSRPGPRFCDGATTSTASCFGSTRDSSEPTRSSVCCSTFACIADRPLADSSGWYSRMRRMSLASTSTTWRDVSSTLPHAWSNAASVRLGDMRRPNGALGSRIRSDDDTAPSGTSPCASASASGA